MARVTKKVSGRKRASVRKGKFAALDGLKFPTFEKGTVWLVGAGPGAPGLLSLLAFHALKSCDVIVYDALVNPDILAWARKGAKLEFAGKRGGRPSPMQRDISLRLVELAQEGKRVLRLKGGDPFLFGRGGEEAQALAEAGIAFRIVPGITAGVGGLAYAGIPATHRDTNQAVLFLTGHDVQGSKLDWQAIARAAPVLVFYMAGKSLGDICAELLAAGRPADDPVCILSNASLPHQEVAMTSLSAAGALVAAHKPARPALVVIGHASDWRAILEWYTPKLRENPLG